MSEGHRKRERERERDREKKRQRESNRERERDRERESQGERELEREGDIQRKQVTPEDSFTLKIGKECGRGYKAGNNFESDCDRKKTHRRR